MVRRPDPAVAVMRIGGLRSVPLEGVGRPALPMILAMILAIIPTVAARIAVARIAANHSRAAMTMWAMRISGGILAITIFVMITIFGLRVMMRMIAVLTRAPEGLPPPPAANLTIHPLPARRLILIPNRKANWRAPCCACPLG